MIGKLKGLVDSIGDDWLILDVGGVGYEVYCSTRTLANLPPVGQAFTLSIETHVREDQIKLYGFMSGLEREWFRLLQSVQGVGSKVALALLGILTPDELASAIVFQDKTIVGRASGVGPKLAQRIVTELKDKVPGGGFTVIEGGVKANNDTGTLEGAASKGAPHDAVSALINLGYGQSQAAGAIALAADRLGSDAHLDGLIKEGLKELAQ